MIGLISIGYKFWQGVDVYILLPFLIADIVDITDPFVCLGGGAWANGRSLGKWHVYDCWHVDYHPFNEYLSTCAESLYA